MIKISVAGGILDVPQQEVSRTFSTMRFSSAIPAQFTTDIELPRTAKNVALLAAYGELDRGQLFGEKIPCFVASELINTAGCLTVDRLTADTITVTVYFGTLPFELLDAKIRDIVPDEEYTSVPMCDYARDESVRSCGKYDLWTSAVALAFGDQRTHIPPYSTYGFPLSPSIRVNYLLQAIGAEIGCTMPFVAPRYYLTAKTLVGSRNVPYVNTYLVTGAGFHELVRECKQVGLTIENDETTITITSDQTCTLKIECRGQAGTTSGTQASLRVWSDNDPTGVTWDWLQPYEQPFRDTLTVTAGVPYHIYIDPAWQDYSSFVLKATTVGQQPQESDQHEAIPLDLLGRLSGHNVARPYIYDCYIGTIACLGDYTVRELLTSLCWQFGQRLTINGTTLSFRPPTLYKTLNNATMTAFEPIFDKLGRQNKLTRPDGSRDLSFGIDNAMLADEVVVQNLSLWSAQVKGMQYAPIFKFEYDEQSREWKPSQEDFDGMVISELLDVGYWCLIALGSPSWLGVDHLGKVALTTWQTYEDVSECDYVYIEGHQYMLVDGTVDEESGLCEFRALEVAQPVATQGRDFSDDFSGDFS